MNSTRLLTVTFMGLALAGLVGCGPAKRPGHLRAAPKPVPATSPTSSTGDEPILPSDPSIPDPTPTTSDKPTTTPEKTDAGKKDTTTKTDDKKADKKKDETKKTDEKKPLVAIPAKEYAASLDSEIKPSPAPAIPPPPEVNLSPKEDVTCEKCGGEGLSEKFVCPENYVMTGFEYASTDDGSGSKIAALKIQCRYLTLDNIDPESSTNASVSGVTQAGNPEAAMDPVDPATVNCPKWSGIANGLFGQIKDGLTSFGLFCGSYSKSAFYRSSKKVHSGDTYPTYGCRSDDPDHFCAQCGENQAMVGVAIRYTSKGVFGFDRILCAEPSVTSWMFPLEKP